MDVSPKVVGSCLEVGLVDPLGWRGGLVVKDGSRSVLNWERYLVVVEEVYRDFAGVKC